MLSGVIVTTTSSSTSELNPKLVIYNNNITYNNFEFNCNKNVNQSANLNIYFWKCKATIFTVIKPAGDIECKSERIL